MKPVRLIHALTDLCLGTMVGVSVGASVAAWPALDALVIVDDEDVCGVVG